MMKQQLTQRKKLNRMQEKVLRKKSTTGRKSTGRSGLYGIHYSMTERLRFTHLIYIYIYKCRSNNIKLDCA